MIIMYQIFEILKCKKLNTLNINKRTIRKMITTNQVFAVNIFNIN